MFQVSSKNAAGEQSSRTNRSVKRKLGYYIFLITKYPAPAKTIRIYQLLTSLNIVKNSMMALSMNSKLSPLKMYSPTSSKWIYSFPMFTKLLISASKMEKPLFELMNYSRRLHSIYTRRAMVY